MPALKEESVASKVTTKSHYRSLGPEFYKVLFDFGGQSPLILYYLKMHELGGISVTHNPKGSKFTKILREPTPPAPTYCDIIKDAKRKFADNKKDFKRVKQRIKEDIKFLKEQQEKIDKELDRLQAKASKNLQEVKNDFENFLHKLRVEAKLKEEYGGSVSPSESPQSPQSPNSSLSFPATSEDFNSVEEGGPREVRSDRHSRTHSSAVSV